MFELNVYMIGHSILNKPYLWLWKKFVLRNAAIHCGVKLTFVAGYIDLKCNDSLKEIMSICNVKRPPPCIIGQDVLIFVLRIFCQVVYCCLRERWLRMAGGFQELCPLPPSH